MYMDDKGYWPWKVLRCQSGCYVGQLGGAAAGRRVKVDPQTKIFSRQCGGHTQPVWDWTSQSPGKSNTGGMCECPEGVSSVGGGPDAVPRPSFFSLILPPITQRLRDVMHFGASYNIKLSVSFQFLALQTLHLHLYKTATSRGPNRILAPYLDD